MNMHIQAPVAARPRTRFAYLYVKQDGRTRCIASNHYGEFGLNHSNQWAWIVGHLVDDTGCNPDDVSVLEGDAGDLIAIKGVAVAELVEE